MTEEQKRAYIEKRKRHGRSEKRTSVIQERWKGGIPKKKTMGSSKKAFKKTSSQNRRR